jgi:hypothetical protein
MMNGEDNQMQEKYRSSGADILFDKYHDFERIPEAINLIAAKKREGNRYGF